MEYHACRILLHTKGTPSFSLLGQCASTDTLDYYIHLMNDVRICFDDVL